MYCIRVWTKDKTDNKNNLLWVRFLGLIFLEKCFNLGVLRLAAVGGAVYNWSGLDAHIFPP